MRKSLILILAAFAGAFAGNCGTDQFLTCNPANVAQLAPISAVHDSNQVAMRTGNGDYYKASAYALSGYLNSGFPQATYQILDTALTGYATLPTDTIRLSCGAVVSGYFVAGISATSNGAALTIGHLPAACRTSHTVVVPLSLVKNNDTVRVGSVSIAATGIMTVSKSDADAVLSATFTASGGKGVGAGSSFTYPRF